MFIQHLNRHYNIKFFRWAIETLLDNSVKHVSRKLSVSKKTIILPKFLEKYYFLCHYIFYFLCAKSDPRGCQDLFLIGVTFQAQCSNNCIVNFNISYIKLPSIMSIQNLIMVLTKFRVEHF